MEGRKGSTSLVVSNKPSGASKYKKMDKRSRNGDREKQPSPNENIDPSRSRAESLPPWNSQKEEKKEIKGRKRIAVSETRESKKTKSEKEWPDFSENFERLKIRVLGRIAKKELEDYNRYVIKKFDEMMTEYKKTIGKEVQDNFQKDVMVMPRRAFKINGGTKFEPIKFSDDQPMHVTFNSTLERLPRVKNWCHTETNKPGPDIEQLTHLPFIGDDDNRKEKERCLLLRMSNHFDEGVHGAHPGCGELISRYQMYKLLKTLRESKEKDYSDPEERKKIDFSIFSMFPNANTYKQLSSDNFFYTLEKRFTKKEEKDIPLRTGQTFATFCVECRQLACGHPDTEVVEKSSIQWKPYWPIISICFNEGPCHSGEACGRKLDCSENFEIPTIDCSTLNAIFIGQLSKQQNLCELTMRMNNLFLCDGHKEMSCMELTKVAYGANRKKVEENPSKKKPRNDRHKIFKTVFKAPSDSQAFDNSAPVIQCFHEGACEQMKCPCFINRTACSLKCKCAPECKILFPGCRCRPGGCRGKQCPCFLGGWECQPNLCGSCNSNIFEPKEGEESFCQNISMQHGWKKQVGVGISTIPEAGMGLFVLQDVKKDELIGEYGGEVISDGEIERRGVVYDELFLSYVFTLVKNHQAVDGYKIGNLMRFANHKFPKDKPNCYSKIIKIQGKQKIGIYASRDLNNREELFFNYGYDPAHSTRFKRAATSQ